MLFKKQKTISSDSISKKDFKKLCLAALNKKLQDEEFIKFSLEARINEKRYFICITSSKIHLIKRKTADNYYIYSINFDSIREIDTNVGLFYGMIVLKQESKKIIIKGVKKELTERFADVLCAQISGYEDQIYHSYKAGYSDHAIATLDNLHKNGVLSDEDYLEQKAQILEA